MTADTYSNTLGFLEMVTGNDNNSWGSNCNVSVFQIFEDAIANALSSAVTGGTLDLSGSPPPNAASQVRYAALIFTGTLASAQTVKVPNLTKWWWVNNQTSGAFTLTIQTPSGSASTAIPQNSGWQLVQCDAANDIIVSPFNSKQIQMPDGSASVPVYSDINETNSGWYRNGTQDWRLAINGVDVLQVTGPGASTPNVVNAIAPASLQSGGVQVIPPGVEFSYVGLTLPGGFLYEYGQAVSRATYPNLLAALRLSFTGDVTSGSPTITSVTTDLRNLGLEGSTLEGAGITGLIVTSVTSTTISMSGNASAGSGAPQTCLAYPFGNGDGSTTFNVPDRRGRVIAGRDNMGVAGASAAGRLTTAGSGVNGILLGTFGGAQNETIAQANLPAIALTFVGNSPGQTFATWAPNVHTDASGGGVVFNPVYYGDMGTAPAAVPSGSISVAGGSDVLGSGTALTTVQPTGIGNYIIKF
jgi:microcystin-dependent protein